MQSVADGRNFSPIEFVDVPQLASTTCVLSNGIIKYSLKSSLIMYCSILWWCSAIFETSVMQILKHCNGKTCELVNAYGKIKVSV